MAKVVGNVSKALNGKALKVAKGTAGKTASKAVSQATWKGVGNDLTKTAQAFGSNFKSAFGDNAVQSLIKSGAGGIVGGGVIGAGVETIRGGDAWDGAKKGAVLGGAYSMGRSALMGGLSGNVKGVAKSADPMSMSRSALHSAKSVNKKGSIAGSAQQFSRQNPQMSKAVKDTMTLAGNTNVARRVMKTK